MRKPSVERVVWLAMAAGAAAASGFLVRQGLQAGWKAVRDEKPPADPSRRSVPWREALIWSGLLGLAAGLFRVVAQKGAGAAWRKVTGRRPPAK